MLHNNKISEQDFKVLSAAIEQRKSRFGRVILFLMNPFQKITGWPALAYGVVITLLMISICWYEKFYIFSILDVARANAVSHPKVALTFWLLLYQSAVNIGVLGALYFIGAKFFRQKNLRIVDFVGMVALARFPLLIAMFFSMLMLKIKPHMHYLAIHPGAITSIYTLLMMAIILWQLTMYFYALKEASGLNKNKLIIVASFSIIIATVLTEQLTMIFVY